MFDGYIRVSSVRGREGASFQSPDQQREKIEGWAKAHGKKIGKIHEDLDVSGGTLSRPGLDAALERIASGNSEGVVVAKLDRLSRAGVADALRLCESIYAAGASVVAIDLGIDPTTPTGKFTRTLMLGLAEMERERIEENWRSSRSSAIDRGVFPGRTPLGYSRAGTSPQTGKPCGPLVKNADSAAVTRAFELSADEGLRAALAFCEETWPDRVWKLKTVRRMLALRVYLGEIQHGEFVNRDAHEPLVDPTVFAFAQHPERKGYRSARSEYPLTGIAACAGCGTTVVGQLNNGRRYRCPSLGCPERVHVAAEPFEELVLEAVRNRPATNGGEPWGDELMRVSNAILLSSKALESWITEREPTQMAPGLWETGLKSREADFENAQRSYDEAVAGHREMPDLDDPTPEQLRTIFELAVQSLAVRRSRRSTREPLEARVSLALA